MTTPRGAWVRCAVAIARDSRPRAGRHGAARRRGSRQGLVADPPVAHAGLGQDQPGSARRVPELASDRPDVDAEIVALVRVPRPPHAAQQPLVGQELPRVGHERFEERVLGLGEVDPLAVEGHQLPPEVDLERPEVERRGLGLVGGAPPQRGAQPGEDLLHPERLGHVVVGPGVERRDLVGLPVADGQDDHGHVGERADASDHLGAVEVRQAEVQEDEVERGLRRRDDRLLTVRRGPHLVAVGLEAGPQRAPDLRFVVDHEHAGHAPRSVAPRAASTERSGPPSPGVGPSNAGSSNTTDTPPVGAPSIRIRPPCARTIARAIVSPSPLP